MSFMSIMSFIFVEEQYYRNQNNVYYLPFNEMKKTFNFKFNKISQNYDELLKSEILCVEDDVQSFQWQVMLKKTTDLAVW